MAMMKLSDAAVALDGRLLGADAEFEQISTDSRAIRAGDLFVALRGERFDGHDFVAAVGADGACGAIVDAAALPALRGCGLPLVVVADSRVALGRLAAHWRSRFDMPVIAVTGSNGKTTTKEMIASILAAAHGKAVLATQGNLNNDIGLPLTLLQMRAEHRAAIVEMGMNHPGEIGTLTGIARPTVAVVTNAQRAHLQGMGSIDAIAIEKGTIYDGLGADGVAVVNVDDAHAALWREKNSGRRVVTFGVDRAADVSGRIRLHGLATELHFITPQGEGAVDLALPGMHNARNALAAIAATLAAGISFERVAAGLAAFRGVKGRLQRRTALNGALVLDDTYNANPDSVRAGIDVLASTIGRKVLVLGDMGEIGEASGQFHDEVGGYAKSAGVDALYGLGEASAVSVHNFGQGGRHYRKAEDLIEALKPELGPGVTLLVKGSRFMRMERVVDAICVASAREGK